MDKKEIEKFKLGGKVFLCDPTRKMIIGIITEVAVMHIMVYWEDGVYKAYSFFRPFPSVVSLTEEEARNFFPDRYDDWVKEPHTQKKKLTGSQILLLSIIIACLVGMVAAFVYSLITK
jgi:hypothetical protein